MAGNPSPLARAEPVRNAWARGAYVAVGAAVLAAAVAVLRPLVSSGAVHTGDLPLVGAVDTTNVPGAVLVSNAVRSALPSAWDVYTDDDVFDVAMAPSAVLVRPAADAPVGLGCDRRPHVLARLNCTDALAAVHDAAAVYYTLAQAGLLFPAQLVWAAPPVWLEDCHEGILDWLRRAFPAASDNADRCVAHLVIGVADDAREVSTAVRQREPTRWARLRLAYGTLQAHIGARRPTPTFTAAELDDQTMLTLDDHQWWTQVAHALARDGTTSLLKVDRQAPSRSKAASAILPVSAASLLLALPASIDVYWAVPPRPDGGTVASAVALATLLDHRAGLLYDVYPGRDPVAVADSIPPLLAAASSSRWLLYTPWEQLGNQVLALASACAVANLTDRTLVLPYVGYRADGAGDAYTAYDPRRFRWMPPSAVWSMTALRELPCRWLDHDTFLGRWAAAPPPPLHVHFHDLGGAVQLEQVQRFYEAVAGLVVADVTVFRPPGEYELNTTTIQQLHGAAGPDLLALGVLFRYHDFGVRQERPIRRYTELALASPLYAAAQRALRPIAAVVELAAAYRRRTGTAGDAPWACLHLRRRDVAAKCRHLPASDAAALSSCLASREHVQQRLRDTLPAAGATLYIMTDSDDVDELRHWRTAAAQSGWHWAGATPEMASALAAEAATADFTPVHWALVDRELCAAADIFIGHGLSSLSGLVLSRRALAHRPSELL